MIFEVEEEIEFKIHGFQNFMKTKYNVNFSLFEKKTDYKIYSIIKKKSDEILHFDNEFLSILSSLEELNYPIKIKTDYNGNFIEIYDFDNWLSEFLNNTKNILNTYEDSENAKDIVEKYYDLLKDKDVFTRNKFKEAYWNLFFFNPPIDNRNKPDIGTLLEWNIKSIGVIPCKGRTKIVNPASKDIIVSFVSNQDLEKNILEKINAKGIKLDDVKIEIIIEAIFDTLQRRIKNKKAIIKCSTKDKIFYKEEISIALIL